jgi:energy-converting hydrogenase Eha subunit H
VGVVANALPQALVLTAIVIGFGLFAFALVLAFRAYHTTLGTLDTDEMRLAEPRGSRNELATDPSDHHSLRDGGRGLPREGGPPGRGSRSSGSVLSLFASGALMVAVLREGVVAAQMGQWAAPFGITLVADLLSAVMVVITAITGLAVAVYALSDIDAEKERLGYHALFQVLIAGVTGAFLTGDLFNLYVWFEVMLISSFGLLVLGGSREQIDGGIKYVALNLISTILFLSGTGLLYGMTGTLNMADLSLAVREVENQGLLTVVAMMFMIAFGVKAAVFPLFFWLPAAYHTPAFSVSAVFAGLLTKVGVYALIRMFTLVFVATWPSRTRSCSGSPASRWWWAFSARRRSRTSARSCRSTS